MSHSSLYIPVALILSFAPARAALPVVTSQPEVYRTFSGEAIRLPVSTNTLLTKVEWRFNGTVISNPVNTTLYTVNNKTTTTLVIPNASSANAGNYVVSLTNKDGTIQSSTIAVIVADEKNPLDSWKSVLPETVAYGINNLAHLNGRFVAGAANGTIHVSSDGQQWQQAAVPPNPLRTTAAQPRIRAVLGHGGRYFAFAEPDDSNNNGAGGWTSPDLLNWEFNQNLPRMGNVAVSNGQRMLVSGFYPGYVTSLASSADGISWERAPASSPFRNSWPERLIAFKGSFFALANNTSTPWYRSDDGVTWTNASGSVPDSFKNSPAFVRFVEFNGELLFFSFGKLWKSPDGMTWSEVVANGNNALGTSSPSAAFTGLGRVWISDSNGNCRNSSDLRNWQYLPYVNNSASPSTAVAGTENVVVCAFNPSGVALTRDAGANFTIFPLNGITSTSGLASTSAGIFAQTSPYLRFSEDGQTWKTTNAFRQSISGGKETIAYGNGVHVRLGNGGRFVSWDGMTWSRQSQQGIFLEGDLAFGNGRFLTLSQSAGTWGVSSSENGTTWSDKVTLPVSAERIMHVNGRFWALTTGYSTRGDGGREYRYATSSDGGSWQAHSIPLTPDANFLNVTGLVAFSGRLILACADSTWWLASDNDGSTWNRLDTGSGFLRNNPFFPFYANDIASPVIHKGWLLASFPGGDIIASSDGIRFHRMDGPGGVMAAHAGALFAATPGGVLRNGTITLPTVRTFGLAEGGSPVRGGTNEIGIVITNHQPGDRIEFRINGVLVMESNKFYAHYAWKVGAFDNQTLVVNVIRASGSSSSLSWATGPAAEVRTRVIPHGLPANGRLAYQQESAGNFYHITPDGVLGRSVDLLNWTSESLPVLSGSSPQGDLFPRIVTRADGARLLAVLDGLWTSPPGSAVWTAVENFPRPLNGARYHFHPSGDRFTLLYQTTRVVARPVEFGGGEAYVHDLERFTSTDGITWTSHGLLPTAGDYKDGMSDGTTILWIEDEGFDESSETPTPVRLWRITATGGCELVEPMPELSPYKVVHRGGIWIVLGATGGYWELGIPGSPVILISDDTLTWSEGVMVAPDIGLWDITAYGDGIWIGHDGSGYYSTMDFGVWSPLPVFPYPPVWVGNRWVNSEPNGSGPIDHYESHDLINWRLVSATWPDHDSAILTVTGERLVTTLGKGLFTMDATGKWAILSGRKNITACQFWNGAWLLGAADGGVGIVHEGVSEHWQNPLNAQQPASSNDSEFVMGFVENGGEMIAFSNRSLYVTTDGQSWSRRDTPPNRSIAGLVRLGGHLILETSGNFPIKRIDSSIDGGRTWNTAILPTGSVNYSNGPPNPSGPFGLYVERGSAFYIANFNQRYRSNDGVTWTLLPANTDAYLPRPVEVEQGLVRWLGAGSYQWVFESSSDLSSIVLTPPGNISTPQDGFYRGRLISLTANGPQITPLANLQVNFPSQAGRTSEAGGATEIAVEVRNTGFDRAWLDSPVFVDVSLQSGKILGTIELNGTIASGGSVMRNVPLVLPRPVAGGRHHLVARLRQDGGLPVDGVPGDDETVSSEALLRVPDSQLGVGSILGGRLMLTHSSVGAVPLEAGDMIEREPLAALLALPDAGQRFVGWSDPSLGMDSQVAISAVKVDKLAPFFAPGPADYRDFTPNVGSPGADPDHDGTPNAIEFLLGSDPLCNARKGWSMTSNPKEEPFIEFVEQKGITSHSLRVSISEDLLRWRALGREQWTFVEQTPATVTWRVRLGTGKQSFVRLEAPER